MTPTLRHGDRSDAVRDLQKRLNAQGAGLVVDALYDDATEAAVRDYQLRVGLVADGMAGPKTIASLNGADCSKLLRHADLHKASERLGISLATVYAVNQIESRGLGFLDNGKPVILFERHIMHRQLMVPRRQEDAPAALRERANRFAASHPNLVNTKPGGYSGGTAEHPRLARARQLHEMAALESASWGSFQIMGFHWQRLGYASVHAFVDAMRTSESEQFAAFVSFIETAPVLHKALKARKWPEFARGYNGPAYAKNLYDIKLKRAYERYRECACQTTAAS
ncbi:N-acetylmuramidase family protein [Pseudomonas viridiflava]|uniref:N-acetylmuramidase domain-containing protein n=1 Tax=Pseudomonas viridiflava TaxID=33069 RepID=UPI001F6072D0|nr:N-acetylmuramidase family protein [Pseudomonas viridiflava]MCI3908854.1 N-acetylmuramidase family protein [Pseudomonas viridiflava]